MSWSFPAWARLPEHVAAGVADTGTGCFHAGAGLAHLSLAMTREAAHRGVWLDRLALSAAAACLVLDRRPEDEAAIRDAHHLTRPGDDSGPAGRMYLFWKRLIDRTPRLMDRNDALSAIALLGTRQSAAEAVDAVWESRLEAGPAPLVAAAAATAVDRQCPGYPALALWLADVALARQLAWPVAVPLLAMGLGRRPFRPAAAEWPALCAMAYARAADSAWHRHEDLGRRADRLRAVSPRLRTKRAPAIVERLLAADAVAPTHLPAGVSDRAGRRLFKRLTDLGAVRELTGRTSFRLYGL